MILVGLTGGIGSGKSVVSSQLAAHGAVVVDADAIVRQLQQPGQDVLRLMVERFGSEILLDSGHLDRARLAERVFGDKQALADLNVENPRTGLCGVLVVDLDPDIAVERLVAQRGFSEADARARVARQASRSARRSVADWIIDNSGSRLDLARQVSQAWSWMCSLPPAKAGAGRVAASPDS